MTLPIGSLEWDKARCIEHTCPLDDYREPERKARIVSNCPGGEGLDVERSKVNSETLQICPRLLHPREDQIVGMDFSDFTATAAP